MKRKIGWLILSSLMALSLVLASCAPAVVEEEKAPVIEEVEEVVEEVVEEAVEEAVVEEAEEGPEMVTRTWTKDDGTTVQRTYEVPKYGGKLTFAWTSSVIGWDQQYDNHYSSVHMQLNYDELFIGDRSKGPGGTGETDWTISAVKLWQYDMPNLALSWESPDPDTVIFNLRPGVNFHNKPPTNGREMTAEDVAATITAFFTSPKSYVYGSYRGWFKSAEATDRYTVTVNGNDQPEHRTSLTIEYVMEDMAIFPKDALEEFGDFQQWYNAIGTGPWMIDDHVPGSSISYVRNPNYWGTDPFFPENHVPYADQLKVLQIFDPATRLAALRTGKLDYERNIVYEDAISLMNTNPEWNYFKNLSYSTKGGITFKVNDPELPWYDKKVRQAVALAIDQESITRDYYQGDAVVHAWPVAPEYGHYIPLEELTDEQRLQYEFDPERAKQLLTEAGYPNGFTMEILMNADDVDIMSVAKAMLADVNIDLVLDVRERGVVTSMTRAKTFKHGTEAGGSLGSAYKVWLWITDGRLNSSQVGPPENDYLMERFSGIWAWESMGKSEVRNQLSQEVSLWALEQVYEIVFPRYYAYTFWAPWMKGFYGSWAIGMHSRHHMFMWAWVDEDLKKSMGY